MEKYRKEIARLEKELENRLLVLNRTSLKTMIGLLAELEKKLERNEKLIKYYEMKLKKEHEQKIIEIDSLIYKL